MQKPTESWIEHQLAESQKQTLKDKEIARQDAAERVAQLRPIGLAKEAAGKATAAEAAAEKAAAKNRKPSHLSQVHRRTI